MKPSENPAWLAVEGWCTPEEGDALCEAARTLLVNGMVMEIGTGYGRSAIAMALSDTKVVSVEYDNDRAVKARKNVEMFNVPVVVYGWESIDLSEGWHKNIAFLFIDGWHDAENVRADYAAWAPHVVPGGSIWFHDAYGAGWPDVHALIDELVASEALVLDGYVGTIAKCRKGAA